MRSRGGGARPATTLRAVARPRAWCPGSHTTCLRPVRTGRPARRRRGWRPLPRSRPARRGPADRCRRKRGTPARRRRGQTRAGRRPRSPQRNRASPVRTARTGRPRKGQGQGTGPMVSCCATPAGCAGWEGPAKGRPRRVPRRAGVRRDATGPDRPCRSGPRRSAHGPREGGRTAGRLPRRRRRRRASRRRRGPARRRRLLPHGGRTGFPSAPGQSRRRAPPPP